LQQRTDRIRSISLLSGDVIVWGGAARLTYHGVKNLAPGCHPLTDNLRCNLTFRRAR
jgi:DNA oxidative demethylase